MEAEAEEGEEEACEEVMMEEDVGSIFLYLPQRNSTSTSKVTSVQEFDCVVSNVLASCKSVGSVISDP